jgi:hypothetical protein
MQRSKDIPVDELLKDLYRLIDTESRGFPVLKDLYEAARRVKAEEGVRLGVGVANVSAGLCEISHPHADSSLQRRCIQVGVLNRLADEASCVCA